MKPSTDQPYLNIQVITFALVVLMSGTLFPFRNLMSEFSFQLVLIPLTAILLYLVMVFFQPERSYLPGVVKRAVCGIPTCQLPLMLTAVFMILSFSLLLYENQLFGEFGYSIGASTAVACLFIMLIVTLLLNFAFRGKYLALALLLALLLIQILSVSSFPLHPARSDMLLLIRSAGERFLAGESPYSNYMVYEEVMLTYLPGMWMTYLPAVLLHIDIRFINTICLAIALIVFLRTCRKIGVDRTSLAFAAVFFLNPWLGFRHEVYIPVFLFQLSLCFSFLLTKRIRTSIFMFAWSLCSFQYSWIVFPLFIAVLYRLKGRSSVVFALCSAGVAVVLLILPFLLWAPAAMVQGVLGTWSGVYQIETFNLSYWILQILPFQSIKLIQIALLLAFYFLAIPRVRDIRSFLLWSTLATLLFMLTSQLIWHYFFLIPPVYMLFYVVSSRGLTGKGAPHSQH